MSTLELAPITDGHITNSKDIQDALSQVGEGKEYDSLHIAAGSYTIDDSVKTKNKYSVLAFNSGSNIYGDLDTIGNPLTKFQLMPDAPISTFSCSVPIFGPSEVLSHDIEFSKFWFDGNCKLDESGQINFRNANCGGHVGAKTQATGKGFSNLFAFPHCGINNFKLHDFKATYTAGDVFRTHQWNQSSNIQIYNGRVEYCGHCAFMFEQSMGTPDNPISIKNCTVIGRGNGAVRFQNSCKNMLVDNVHVIGTKYDYNSGMQLEGDNVTVINSLIENTMGPGIEFHGFGNKNLLIKNNKFKNCGTFSAANKITGVGGVLHNGVYGTIENNVFEDCKGFGVVAGIYSPDGSIFQGKGYTVTVKDNIFINTTPANYTGGQPSGYHIANILQNTHNVVADGNVFYPATNMFYNVTFQNKSNPSVAIQCVGKEEGMQIIQLLKSNEILD